MKQNLKHSAPIVGALLVAIVLGTVFAINIIGRIAPLFPFPFSGVVADSADPLVSKVNKLNQISEPTLHKNEFIRGDANAPVKIFEFSDFACPYCATMAKNLAEALAGRKDVAIVWRDFPITSLHKTSLNAHVAAHCAGEQGRFWDYHDKLFSNQNDFSRDRLLALAGELKLKTETFAACLDSQTPLPTISQNVDEGNALGIDGTPYLFIDDQRVSGQLSTEELNQIINLHALLNQKK